MSITISQLLKLPSLQEAQVCAGKEGLQNIVSSISVLEYAQPSCLQDELFHHNEFQGGEIVISGFVSIKEDIQAQCDCIQRLHEAGEIGLILYYVGIFVKKIDQRVIDIANALHFPILLMPLNRMDLRYSEVIQEVMESIFIDRKVNNYFVSEMLERISRLPNHQRSMDSVLRMLSDRTHISYYLVDETYAILNSASWPKKANFNIDEVFMQYQHGAYEQHIQDENRGHTLWVSNVRIENEDSKLIVFMISEENTIDSELITQAQEVIQLFIHIWSQSHGAKRSDELIRSILQDEPVKMRRLAEILHIDVASIHSMWMVQAESSQALMQLQQASEEFLHVHYHLVISAIVKDALIIFMGNPCIKGNEVLLKDLFIEKLQQQKLHAVICASYSLKDTASVRNAYMDILDYVDTAQVIYPNCQFFTLSQITFAKTIKQHIDEGEYHVANMLQLLYFETKDEDIKEELLRTLCVFLLDGDMRMQKTADLLFLHKNTVKYRIQQLRDKLHSPIDQMPEALEYYTACAIYRLLHPIK